MDDTLVWYSVFLQLFKLLFSALGALIDITQDVPVLFLLWVITGAVHYP